MANIKRFHPGVYIKENLIAMEMTAKDDHFFFLIQRGNFALVIVKNIVTVPGLDQKATVVHVSYFHTITCEKN